MKSDTARSQRFFNSLGTSYSPVMPFDVHDFPDASRMDRAATRQSRRLVAIWLFTVAAMIMVMIVLGGATRLTGSGLSIMEWAPMMGALPPTSDAEWHRLFALYQKIPQYTLVQRGFGLAGFKHIFWLEWTHRLWGRLIGVVFLLPMLWLWATARIERRLVPRLGLLFVLGGLQGAVGWFMVASGFLPELDRGVAVSPRHSSRAGLDALRRDRLDRAFGAVSGPPPAAGLALAAPPGVRLPGDGEPDDRGRRLHRRPACRTDL